MPARHYLAIDCGASGGRCIRGSFDRGRIQLEPIHSFPNGGIERNGRLFWDEGALWREIQIGLAKAAERGEPICSVGVDTWGVDFGLLDDKDRLIASPYHYRDRHTQGILPRAFRVSSREAIFEETGLQFMELNTLFQLFAMREARDPVLENASKLLLMPDLFHWMLCGATKTERTNASTTQLYNPRTQSWSTKLIESFGLPAQLFCEIVDPGTILGTLRTDLVHSRFLSETKVVAPASHDTASAVLAVPATGFAESQPEWCYISSGTWSLMGLELEAPRIEDRIRQLNFTNEAGVGGTTRLLKNISGLWLLQECQRAWREAGHNHDWPTLVQLAKAEQPLRTIIDPDDPSFLAPSNMPQAIQAFCKAHDLRTPETLGQFVRCCLESLSEKYRQVFEHLCTIAGRRLTKIHIVGGGAQNELLCQMTADACGAVVLSGPVEATALGNVIMQMVADKLVPNFSEARQIVRESCELKVYTPHKL
ncbi:MAG TPA: rhamnulokinase family protein [Pirellulaceae bacterium]|nr:rhamnulokinase family protein [Pirellulaceae bacterium]HMO93731.1 rhamnulokinase family protein [Pirellulaceae bacterium]HMP69766.1 rhamnulokinase family protein [Pirellulaceae bacterium]